MRSLNRVQLDDADQIGRGSERTVYRVASLPGVLVKVMRSKHLRRAEKLDDRKLVDWLKIKRAYGLFRREERAWQNAMLRASRRNRLPPIAPVHGLILTDRGLAQLVSEVPSETGEPGKTLADFCRTDTLGTEHLDALNHFVAELYDFHIPAYDLGPKNIVFDARDNRFVLVDGLGDRALIPLVTWFKPLNDFELGRAFSETAEKTGLIWDRRARRFSKGKPA